MQKSWARAFARLLLRISPKPDLSYVLDADPEVARERKPEYPLEFMRHYRSSYLTLRKMAGLELIQAGTVEEVHQAIIERFKRCVVQKEIDSSVHSPVAA
jgi:thymidylate kinase